MSAKRVGMAKQKFELSVNQDDLHEITQKTFSYLHSLIGAMHELSVDQKIALTLVIIDRMQRISAKAAMESNGIGLEE